MTPPPHPCGVLRSVLWRHSSSRMTPREKTGRHNPLPMSRRGGKRWDRDVWRISPSDDEVVVEMSRPPPGRGRLGLVEVDVLEARPRQRVRVEQVREEPTHAIRRRRKKDDTRRQTAWRRRRHHARRHATTRHGDDDIMPDDTRRHGMATKTSCPTTTRRTTRHTIGRPDTRYDGAAAEEDEEESE